MEMVGRVLFGLNVGSALANLFFVCVVPDSPMIWLNWIALFANMGVAIFIWRILNASKTENF